MHRDIDVLDEEMVAAGVRIFVGGLAPARSAKSLRAQPNGKVLITDGPYLETKEPRSSHRKSKNIVSLEAVVR